METIGIWHGGKRKTAIDAIKNPLIPSLAEYCEK
jgi:hypothetical protein